MKHSTSRNIKLVTIALVAIGLTIFMFVDDKYNLGFAGAGAFSFTVPNPNAFAGSGNVVDAITCKLKSTLTAVDTQGVVLANLDSSLYQGSPFFALTDRNNKEMAGYINTLKMWCSGSGATVVVPVSTLNMWVHSKDSNGNEVQTGLKQFKTQRTTFASGDGEKNIGFASIQATQIASLLDQNKAEFNSLQKFQITGNLKIAFADFEFASTTYTIPITNNKIVVWHNAKIVNDVEILDPELADPDGDGIINKFDDCPNQRETFNNYKDSDGCPDTVPSGNGGTDTDTPTDVVTQSSCKADSKTWYLGNLGEGYCGTRISYSNGVCGVYDVPTATCKSPTGLGACGDGTSEPCAGTTDDTDTSDDTDTCNSSDPNTSCVGDDSNETTINGKMLWQVDVVNKNGKKWAFIARDDPSPFSFSIPLALTGGFTTLEQNEVSTITAQGMLKFDTDAIQRLVDTKTSDVTYAVWVQVDGAWHKVKEQKASQFIPANGAGKLNGLSLGTITIRASEIENKVLEKIGSTFVGTEPIGFKIVANGDVGITYNVANVGIKELTVHIINADRRIDTDGDGINDTTVPNDSSFVWTNLNVVRGGGQTAPSTFIPDCDSVTENLKATSVINGVVTYECVPKGAVDKNDPLPKIGDTGVEICIDNNSGSGGFPCDKNYRDLFCQGTTQCGSVGTDGTVINPKVTEDDDGNLSCSTLLNLHNTPCVIITGGDDGDGTSTHGDNLCFSTTGQCASTGDPNMIWYIAIGILIVGIIAIALKRRK